MQRTVDSVKTLDQFTEDTLELFTKIFDVRITSFEDQLEKLQTA